MKKYVTGMLISVVLLFVGVNAYAEGTSLALKFGFFIPRATSSTSGFSSGLNYEGAIGFRPHTNIGAEFSVGTFSSSSKTSSTSTSTNHITTITTSTLTTSAIPILATIKFILPVAYEAFELSLGGGLGYYLFTYSSSNESSTTSTSLSSNSALGYHVVSSIEVPVTSGFLLGVEGRWTYIDGDFMSRWFGLTVNGMFKFLL
jgi:hypothetical protein